MVLVKTWGVCRHADMSQTFRRIEVKFSNFHLDFVSKLNFIPD